MSTTFILNSLSGAINIKQSVTAKVNLRATTMAMASAKCTSTPSKASGRYCALGYGHIAASHRSYYRSISDFSNMFTMSANAGKPCWDHFSLCCLLTSPIRLLSQKLLLLLAFLSFLLPIQFQLCVVE